MRHRRRLQPESGWHKVIFAADCDDGCCPACGDEYAVCSCPGPDRDGFEYRTIGGVLYARRIADV
jgi:hypothetical protein